MELDYKRISGIVGIPQDELQTLCEEWFASKKSKSIGSLVVDLKLIATLSGLSVSSVSNFFNNKKGSLSKEKTNMLEKLIEVVGYIPSSAAKKLRSSHKMSIGFVFSLTSGTSTEYFVNILRGLKREADKYGYFIDIYDIKEDQREEFFAEPPFIGLVDGLIIVASVVNSEQLTPLIKRNIPVVLINPLTKEIYPPVVAGIYSDATAFSQLLDHLFIDHTYKNPMLISVELKNSAQRLEKYNMFVKAVRDNGIDFSETKHVVFVSSHSFSESMRAYDIAKEKNPDADVFVCLTDTLAVPFVRGLEKDKKKVAVTGYANFEIAQVFDLTTIEQNIQLLGSKAFQHLFFSMQYIQRHNTFPEYSEEMILGEFIRRSSCGCAE